jgi:hypothetical protein
MTAGAWWQILGGALEFVGLVLVMVGISDTRRSFTNRPSVAEKFLSPIRGLYRKLFRKTHVVELKAGFDAAVGLDTSARLRRTMNWKSLSPEEATTRMQEAIDEHEEMLGDLAQKLDAERAERTATDKEEQRTREQLRQMLEARIADAAAGGLTREVWGTGAFALGIVFTVVGVWVG